MAIKIFIDQGHNPGGINGGATGFGINEQDVTFNVGIYLRDLLNNDPRFEARTSRQTITEVLGTSSATSLRTRVEMANSWPANYFISIHCNANVNPAINGSEVYVYALYTEAANLAESVLEFMVDTVGTRYNGVRENPSLYVLRRTQMPSILIELAYITNYEDNLLLQNEQYTFAYGIYLGILNYFGFQPLE
ncbi:N-acetylmuramoyl-L-alanine amidase family protein [Lachnoclostridium phytofermentans]|uniref:Cell wall hydrolase/autolysin n=1 Tax=Lachnoclostridium phytofermentans (strain ATCC 700394 / DSM 18823 / ISDg) TaxID=357809 RepID=A9KP08_LACP7|nr:N-acetylmuramoyl-L-alanine amidase [Lachnoclostridium phytofermentans]ABX43178.1 cell wall hydrolase/autolysin [Lachnoclostridium phytofermentans ISDg]